MSQQSKFVFEDKSFDHNKRKATFVYRIYHNGEVISFKEEVQFPDDIAIKTVPKALLDCLLDNLHLILGVSYWKTYAPQQIELQNLMLSKDQSTFWNSIYTYGMGEFFYKNKLNFHEYITFPFDENYSPEFFEIEVDDRALVGVGGGKDSVVATELMKKSGKELTSFVVENVGQSCTNDKMVETLGLPSLKIKRSIDPKVGTLPHSYHGHIPISAIYAFLGVTASVLYGYKYFVVANEQSSNYGNVEYLGVEVNHQWSKSAYFEKMFQEYVHKNISPKITYFSLLRPFSELKIVELFSKYPKYFPVFTSCNQNYRIRNGEQMTARWCGECPKCAFAFVMLSAFLTEQQVLQIVGKNMFENETLLDLYRELLGTKNIKPLDCVGTPDEVSTALIMAKEKGIFVNTQVMKMFEAEVLPAIYNSLAIRHTLFAKTDEHSIPSELLPVISNI